MKATGIAHIKLINILESKQSNSQREWMVEDTNRDSEIIWSNEEIAKLPKKKIYIYIYKY